LRHLRERIEGLREPLSIGHVGAFLNLRRTFPR
jgi:hypothetical protein